MSLGLLIGVESSGQLVRRKDYDLAVALQAGGGTSVGIPFRDVRMFVVPVGGLKMTIPFTRKWFLGTEVNYADHRFDSRYAPGGKYRPEAEGTVSAKGTTTSGIS